MISQEFKFYRPTELSETLSLLAQDLGDVRVLAGGMTLVSAMNLGLARPDAIVSLNHVKSLASIAVDNEGVRLGALVRHRQVDKDDRIRSACPLLSEAAGLIADVQVRHRGTVGGSLAHADPSANYIPAMVALSARFRLVSRSGDRRVAAIDFIKGALETDIQTGEILVEVFVPSQTSTQSSAFYRLARAHGSFAIVNAAAVVDSTANARVVVCGATGTPIVVEEAMSGVSENTDKIVDRLSDAAHAACREPIDDLYSGHDYRRSMVRVAARRVLTDALARRRASKK